MDSKPLVGIGMPVYNGEKYIRQALDSLLAQDYENFELIISDNASTDGTPEICRQYVARDKRIRYYQNETNRGAVANFNRVFELSSGKYFMWAADHDLWHTTFIARCVSILETNSDVVLVYSRTMLIDSGENTLGIMPDQIDTRGMPAVQRYKHIMWNLSWCNMVYGVIRKSVLSHIRMSRNVWGWDNAFLAELAFRGAFAQIADPLYYRRQNRPELEGEMHKRRVLFDLDPATASEISKKSFESLSRELGNTHLQIVACAPINLFEKINAAIATVVCFRERFEVRWCIAEFAWWIAVHFIPQKVRRKILSSYYKDSE